MPSETPSPIAATAPTSAPEPESTATPDPTSTATITKTLAASATPAATFPRPVETVPSDSFTIDASTTWHQVVDSLESPDWDCVRGALGESLEGAIAQTEIEQKLLEKLLPCLNPEDSRHILPIIFVASLAREGWDLTPEEVSCLRKEIGDIEVMAYMSGEEGAVEDFAKGTILCVPRPLIHQFTRGLGMERGEASEDEIACLQQGLLDVNWANALADESAATGDFLAVMFECVPGPVISRLVSGLGISVDDLDENEVSCLKARQASFGWLAAQDDETAAVAAVISGLLLCLPAKFASRMVAESGLSDVLEFNPEDLSEEDALCIGSSMAGLDWMALVDDDPAARAEFADALYSCAPGPIIAATIREFGLEMEHIGAEEEACLSEWVAGIDWRGVFADDPNALGSMDAGFRDCLAEVLLNEGGAAAG